MIKPLEYETGLSLEEAEERLREIRQEFADVKGKYSGLITRFYKKIAPEDIKTLSNCVGVLLPLQHEQCVQGQVSKSVSLEESLMGRLVETQEQIMIYLTRFENSGAKAYPGLRLD